MFDAVPFASSAQHFLIISGGKGCHLSCSRNYMFRIRKNDCTHLITNRVYWKHFGVIDCTARILVRYNDLKHSWTKLLWALYCIFFSTCSVKLDKPAVFLKKNKPERYYQVPVVAWTSPNNSGVTSVVENAMSTICGHYVWEARKCLYHFRLHRPS